MEIINHSEFIEENQLKEVINLFSTDVKNSDVRLYILRNDEGFQNVPMNNDLEVKVERFLQNQDLLGIYMYPEDVIFFVEERLLKTCNMKDEFYANMVWLLSHELRHYKQAYFLEDRFHIMMRDYSLDYGECFTNNQLHKLHWCEKDAFTYSYQFVTKYQREIMSIFGINDWLYYLPVEFFVDYEREWLRYKRDLPLLAQIFWTIKDVFWRKRVLI
ncbi:hypothetical protein [Priestia aryabhattai]|uniref:hypothetical protein n=1 Tax=Priestia aryabhattai TaxID=412384 RepID=UPI0027E3BD04|nr:hypothetical protein [Priestia aryabhattai]MCG0050253.1 hypothetical protein [Priestia aryabhattai]